MCAPDGLLTWRQLGPVALTAPPTPVALAGIRAWLSALPLYRACGTLSLAISC